MLTYSFFRIIRQTAALCFLLLYQNTFAQPLQKKVLFIGIDGCRWDAVFNSNAVNIQGLLNNAALNREGITEYKTWSGTGWSGMLTGTWHTKHGVSDNTFSGMNYSSYPDFLSRAENYNPSLNTFAVVHWAPLCDNIIQNVDTELIFQTDVAVKNASVDLLNNSNPDILFIAFDDVDHAGHTYGFGEAVPQYLSAIENIDGYVGEIITALHNRPSYANEDWLTIVTTDHGGIQSGHGGGTLEERTIFQILHNPSFSAQTIDRQMVNYTDTFNELRLPAGTYAVPADQNPFQFGTNQDFTIELWVKAASYTGDPAFISNKDWNSGLNPGVVISAQQGQYWKVNIGDGINRADIQGGYINPGEWHHLAVIFDRDSLMTAYEDGVLVGFENIANIGNLNTGLPWVINQDGTTNYGYDFSGSYRDIRIWNVALPDSLIAQWASSPVNASHPNYNNLISNWMCEDGSGTNLFDSGLNSNYCTINGTPVWFANTSNTFTIYDASNTHRQQNNAPTVLNWLCIPVQDAWGIDGVSTIPECIVTGKGSANVMEGFSLHPNPASAQLMITQLNTGNETGMLQIFNALGKLIMQKPISEKDHTERIDTQHFANGVYLMNLITRDFTKSKPFVISHNSDK